MPPIMTLVLIISQASGQDIPIRLTADEAVAAALSNSRSLKIAALNEQVARARCKETEAAFLPQVGISWSAMTTDNPLNAFGFRLQQKAIGQTDFDPARLNHPAATPDFMTSFDVQQPLLNMDLVYQRRSISMQTEASRLQGRRTKEEVIFSTREAYMQLQLAYQVQKVMEDALTSTLALYLYTSHRVDQGMLTRADALNTRVRVKTIESQLAEAKSQVRNASDHLGFLMGQPPGPVYATDSTPGSATDTAVENRSADPANSSLPDDRADLSALRTSIRASDLMIRSLRMSALPRLNAFGSYQFNDSRMFGFGAAGYIAGVRLSWDIFKGNSIHNRSATLALEKSRLSEQYALYKEQSEVELNAALRKRADAGFRISQQQVAVAAAAESYRILRDRYEQGLSGSTDVLLAQTQVAQQQLALARAVFDLDLTRAYIDFLTTSSEK